MENNKIIATTKTTTKQNYAKIFLLFTAKNIWNYVFSIEKSFQINIYKKKK